MLQRVVTVVFINDCLVKTLRKPKFATLVLLSDATGSQTRNITVTKVCARFARLHNVEVIHLYPVRGQSFSLCDRNFGLVRNDVKNRKRIGSALPWLDAIVTC